MRSHLNNSVLEIIYCHVLWVSSTQGDGHQRSYSMPYYPCCDHHHKWCL